MSRSCQSGWFSSDGVRVAAQEPGQPGDALRQDRVALVGHRRRAFLAGLEWLLDLADLGVLEIADLGRDALQGAAQDRDRGQQRGMPVALDDLRAYGVGMQAQLGEDLGLDVGVEMAVRADRPGDLAGPDLVDGRRQAGPAAVDLERPAGELEPERRRLGVDRVGAAHHRRVGLGPGAGDEHGQQAVAVAEQSLAGGAQLERQARVDDVAARQAEVQIAALGSDRLRHLRHEGDDVVVGRALDLGDPIDVDLGAGSHRLQRRRRDQAARRLGTRDGELDAEHLLEPRFLRPDRPHLGERVAPDHRAAARGMPSAPMSWRRCCPSNAIMSAAASACARAASRSRPRPTTVTIRPPSVR